MGVSDFRLQVEKLMILYGEIWSTHAGDRLGEIFSEDIQYIEKPTCVMDGMSNLQQYWRCKVGHEKDVKYEALFGDFDVCEAESWAWVKFRASFKTHKKKANQWVARITINSDGLISVLEEYWSAIAPQAVGMEQACLDWEEQMTSIRTDAKAVLAAWETSPQQGGAESKGGLPRNNNLALLKELDLFIDSVRLLTEQGFAAEAIFVDLPHMELHHFVARLEGIDKSLVNVKCSVRELFDYIDSDGDGVITAADFKKAIKTYYVCLRRICITDSLHISGTFKNLGVLQIGDMVEFVGQPIRDSSTGMLRVKCKAPGACEGFVTMIGNQGTVFFRASSPSSDFLAQVHHFLQPAHKRLCKLTENIHAQLANIFELGDPYYLNRTRDKLLKLDSALQALFEAFGTVETDPFATFTALCGEDHQDKSQVSRCSEKIAGEKLLPADIIPLEDHQDKSQLSRCSKNIAGEKHLPADIIPLEELIIEEFDEDVVDENGSDREIRSPPQESARSSGSLSCAKEAVHSLSCAILGAKAKSRAHAASNPQQSGKLGRGLYSDRPLARLMLERTHEVEPHGGKPQQFGKATGKQEQPLDDVVSDHATAATTIEAHAPISARPNGADHAYQLHQHFQSVQPYEYYLSSQQYWATACSAFYGAFPMPGAFSMPPDMSGFHSHGRSKHKRKRSGTRSQRSKQSPAKSSQSRTSTSTSSSPTPKAKCQKKRRGSSQKQRSSSDISSCTSEIPNPSHDTDSDSQNVREDDEDNGDDHENHENHEKNGNQRTGTSSHSPGLTSQQMLSKELDISELGLSSSGLVVLE